MAAIEQIAVWRAKRAAREDEPLGARPFDLEEPCPGCGVDRVSTMVWRRLGTGGPVAFPRIEPHYLCREGEVVFQDITDAPMPVSSWTRILGRFRA